MIEVWRPGRTEGRRRPASGVREQRRHEPQAVPRASKERRRRAGGHCGGGDRPRRRASRRRLPLRPSPDGLRAIVAGGANIARTVPTDRARERERPPVRPTRFERREREKAPDPNSPFAKLAALKAQLEADAKERR